MSRAFFSASEVRVGPRIRSNSRSVEVWISFTMPVPTTTVPSCTAGASRCSWSSRSPRLFGTRTSRTSTRAGGVSRVVSSPTEPASTPRRARLARVASRVRNESVICAGRCSASAVTSAPQRSPTTTTVPDSGTFSSARCRSRYSSDASQARSLSRGSSGKRDSSNSPQCVFIRSFIVGKASRAAAQGVSGRMETMDAGLFPRPRTQIAPGAVHVPDWLDPGPAAGAGGGLPGVGAPTGWTAHGPHSRRRHDDRPPGLPGLALVSVRLRPHRRRR
ncbi:hypothetical protein SALBM311S_07568 [Streptomyces alboniger]